MSNYIYNAATVSEPSDSTTDEKKFIRLESEAPRDVPDELEQEITQGELVDIFASIFGRGSCGGLDDPDAYTGPPAGVPPEQAMTEYLQEKYPGREGAQKLAEEFGIGELCRPGTLDGGEIEKTLYVHCSDDDVFSSYDVVAHGAEIGGQREVNRDIYLRVEFSNVSSMPLYYYVDLDRWQDYLDSPLVYGYDLWSFRGRVIDANGDAVENPTIAVKQGVIYLPGNSSGILVIKRLPIKYHTWDLKIPGVLADNGDRQYLTMAMASAPGLAPVTKEIEQTITAEETKERCPWLDLNIDPNPGDGSTTLDCGNCDDDDEEEPGEAEELEPYVCNDKITEAEYKEKCCNAPLPDCLPSCRTIEEVFNGPVDIEGGRQKWIDEYDGPTSFVALMPEDGAPCGTITHRFTDPGKQCCTGVDPLVYDEENPEIVARGQIATISVSGGKSIMDWSLEGGSGFSFTGNGQTKITGGPVQGVQSSADSCGTVTIKIDDGCSTVDGPLSSTGGTWVEDYRSPGSSDFQFVETCERTEKDENGQYQKKRYYNDWCVDSESNCTGTEQNDCGQPDFPGHSPIRVEWRLVTRWGCE